MGITGGMVVVQRSEVLLQLEGGIELYELLISETESNGRNKLGCAETDLI
jgi:hypothetical protein